MNLQHFFGVSIPSISFSTRLVLELDRFTGGFCFEARRPCAAGRRNGPGEDRPGGAATLGCREFVVCPNLFLPRSDQVLHIVEAVV